MKYKSSFYNVYEYLNSNHYIVNTYSRAILKLDSKEDYQNINQNNLKKYSQDELLMLFDNGFIVDIDTEEISNIEYMYKYNYFNNTNLSITILPTLDCNFKCPYCFEDTKFSVNDDKFIERFKNFGDKNFPKKSNVHIGWFGGEPLLKYDSIVKLMKYYLNIGKKYNSKITCNLTSNGYLLDKEKIITLINELNCTNIQITIDGNKNKHNKLRKLKNGGKTFEKILRNIKNIIDYIKIENNTDFELLLRINLLNTSEADILELLNNFNDDEKKWFYIYFRPIYNTDNFKVNNCNSNSLKNFYNLARKNGFRITPMDDFSFSYCEGDSGLNTLQITPDFKLWKCMNDYYCEGAVVGKIEENGKLNINLKNSINWSRNNPFLDAECKDCKYLPLCFGGCPLNFFKYKERSCFYERDFSLVEMFNNKK